jgi:hypothetical protein
MARIGALTEPYATPDGSLEFPARSLAAAAGA